MLTTVSSPNKTPNPKGFSRAPAPAKPKRAPLLPSEADNNGNPLPRRPKSRDVNSRYLSSISSSNSSPTTMTSTSSSSSFSSTTTSSSSNSMCTPRRRFPSPLVSGTNHVTPASSVNNKRPQSAERRRPGTSRTGEVSASTKMLTASARSLSVSFQGESFALQVSKAAKPAPSTNGLRNGTPERRKAVTPARNSENSKPIDQQRWPGRSRQESSSTRSVDFTNEKMKLSGSGNGSAVRALQKSMIDETKLKPNKPEIPEFNKTVKKLGNNSDNSDRAVSDTESVSSGSTPGTVQGGGPRGVMVPARFWQETVNRLRRVRPEPVSPPLSKNKKLTSGSKFLNDGPTLSPQGSSASPIRGAVRPSKFLNDGPTLSPRGSLSSPLRGAVRPASPSKRVILSSTSSSSRGLPSPPRTPHGVRFNSNLGNTPSVLSLAAAEARRGKVGVNKLVDAHDLRLLHNKHLQWRFANARAEAAMEVQRATAQKSLYNAWVTTSKMWQSVISKQIEIQRLRQNLTLHSVLEQQIPYLDLWDQSERDHSISLSEAILALESSTLRLPVGAGAKADVQNLKDAICSAVDVMQAMASSICFLQTKVEHVSSLASELASTATDECSLLGRCKDLFSTLTLLEVQDCSLRTHILQQRNATTTEL